MVKQAKITRTYPKAARPIKIGLHDFVQVVQTIGDERQIKKFIEAARVTNASVSLHPKTVNFVKGYITRHNLRNHPAIDRFLALPGEPTTQLPVPFDPFRPKLTKSIKSTKPPKKIAR